MIIFYVPQPIILYSCWLHYILSYCVLQTSAKVISITSIASDLRISQTLWYETCGGYSLYLVTCCHKLKLLCSHISVPQSCSSLFCFLLYLHLCCHKLKLLYLYSVGCCCHKLRLLTILLPVVLISGLFVFIPSSIL